MPRIKPKMVDWYNPIQLAKTGIQALFSTTLGRMIDPRTLIGIEGENADCVFDYSDREESSFDYLADTGDGWDSTYTMAYLATAPHLEVYDGDVKCNFDRADLLILGGDQVYPVASEREYEQRLSSPFKAAAKEVRSKYGRGQARNDIFLIPGNHDWYDALGSMSKKYFAYERESKDPGEPTKTVERKLGQFDTRQKRGYFVIKLPNDWEVWCVDIQLGNDIDRRQLGFFKWHSEDLSAETKVVICSAMPTIVYGSNREHLHIDALTFGLATIVRCAYDRGAKVIAQIAGDVHNYQHYEFQTKTKDDQPYQREHIVCGGGGAFLHPTHSFNKGSEDNPRIDPVVRYPSRRQSKKLSNQILKFPVSHFGLSVVLAAFYFVMFWNGGSGAFSFSDIFNCCDVQILPIVTALIAVFGCAAFGYQKVWWGAVHGLAHIFGAIATWCITISVMGLLMPNGANALGLLLSVLLVGSMVGGFIFGLYLWVSLNLFRVHHNEAFSAIGSAHYKSMLRCSIDKDGSLTIRVIGVEASATEGGHHPVRTHLIETINVR
jgi:hypothetical protein